MNVNVDFLIKVALQAEFSGAGAYVTDGRLADSCMTSPSLPVIVSLPLRA